ncbi:PhnD/SsuA/transferrin family substrate-binding protein [Rhodoferax sp. 4810]|nr:PhnD/SsuA/transferrin family substrate-binding protein [Rhodoferax jenense]
MRLLRFWLALALLFGWGWVRAEPPPIAIGFYLPVIRDVPRRDVELSLRFWVEELGAAVKLSYKPIRFYENMADLRRDMASGEINFMVATSMGVVQNFAPEELADGFSGLKAQADHLLLAVRRGSGIRSLPDLIGKRLEILERDELSEVYLETLLMKAGDKQVKQALERASREKRSVNLVHGLFFGKADAALIYRNAYEAALAMNPQIGQQLQVLDVYSFHGRSPHIGLFSSHVAPQDAQAITTAAMTLGNTSRGRQVLDIYNADQMVITKVQDLEPFRDLLVQHRLLRASMAPARKKGSR